MNRALSKWRACSMRADNTSCVVVLIDPLGPRKLSILKKKREEHFKRAYEINAKTTELGKKLAEANKTGTRTSPRKCSDGKSVEDTPAVTTVLKPACDPFPIRGDKCAENSQRTWKDPIDSVSVAARSLLTPGDRGRYSLPGSQLGNNSLDDSVQATSAHNRVTFTPGLDQASDDKVNLSTTSHNMPTVDVSPTKKALVGRSSAKSSENKSLVEKKPISLKLSSCLRTRQRHLSSNTVASRTKVTDAATVMRSMQKLRDTCDVMSRDKKSANCVLSRDKRALSMPVLTDSQKQQQASNRIQAARDCIKAGLRGAMKGILNAGSSNLLVKTSSDLNRGHVKRHPHVHSAHALSLRSAGKSNNNNSSQNHIRAVSHGESVKMPTKLRSSLRLKSGHTSKCLRSSAQVENKHFVTRTRLAGTKRKADSPVDLATVKRLCRH